MSIYKIRCRGRQEENKVRTGRRVGNGNVRRRSSPALIRQRLPRVKKCCGMNLLVLYPRLDLRTSFYLKRWHVSIFFRIRQFLPPIHAAARECPTKLIKIGNALHRNELEVLHLVTPVHRIDEVERLRSLRCLLRCHSWTVILPAFCVLNSRRHINLARR
jgi:hypothetical protein